MKISRSKSKTWIIVASALFLVVGAYLVTAYALKTGVFAPREENGINLSPATEDDKKFNDEIKQDIVRENPQEELDSAAPPEKKSVTPVISAYGQPEGSGTDFKLNGYAPGVVESDGTCTLVLTKGDIEVTTSKGALQNAQNTSCGQLTIPYSQLSPGNWQAVLSYNSPTSSGSSTTLTIEIK